MTDGRMLRAYGSVPVNSFVFERTFSCRTPFPYSPTNSRITASRPFVLLFTSCSLADLRMLIWSSLNIRTLTPDYFLRIKLIGLSEIRKVLLANAKHVVLDATSSSERVVSHGGHVVVYPHSFKKAFHTQCRHTFKKKFIKKMYMSSLCQCVSKTGK